MVVGTRCHLVPLHETTGRVASRRRARGAIELWRRLRPRRRQRHAVDDADLPRFEAAYEEMRRSGKYADALEAVAVKWHVSRRTAARALRRARELEPEPGETRRTT
jgi:hypothetical protein